MMAIRKGRPAPPNSQKKASSIDCIIGNRIRQRRLEQKCSQSDLAKVLGVTFQQVQKYERGANRVGAARLQLIATTLKADISYFMGDLEGDAAKPPTLSRFASFMATKDGAEIVEAMIRISNPEHRKGVIALARTLGSCPP